MPPTYTAPVKRPEPAPPQDEPVDSDLPTEALANPPAIAPVPFSPPATPLPHPPIDVARAATIPPKPVPAAAARTRPAEIPWPDAFEPRPNYRKRDGRNWSWLLLFPAGLVAAAAITLVDARSVRTWIDTTILHRSPVAGTLDSPLLPGAFRTGTVNTPSAGAPSTGTLTTGTPTTDTIASKPAQEDIPYPAIPTSPVPVPPGTEVSPPPSEPVDAAAAAATPIHVTIQFRRNVPGADGEARRLAALLQSYGGSIELHPNATTARVATINYYNAADKDAAAALATALSNEAASWIVRLGTTKNPPGTLDVWLP